METTNILWSGLTGKTGREAVMAARNMPDVKIVLGITRHDVSGVLDVFGKNIEGTDWVGYDMDTILLAVTADQHLKTDVIVDFSHPDVFDKVLELTIRTGKPLVSGTSGLSDRQMASLYDATNRIPIFHGDNFRFRVKKFIDESVKLAMTTAGTLTLYENFYEGKSLPSETSQVIQKRIHEATGKTIKVYSEANLLKEQFPCHWRLDLGTELRNGLTCHTVGFGELAHDVLRIAKVMARKPIKEGEFYDLDELWDDLVSWAL